MKIVASAMDEINTHSDVLDPLREGDATTTMPASPTPQTSLGRQKTKAAKHPESMTSSNLPGVAATM